MSRPIYRRGRPYTERTRKLIRLAMTPEQDSSRDRYTRALAQSIREHLTPRELECMEGYYIHRCALDDLGPKLGINPSTASRNVRRGEGKLDKIMRLAEEISPLRLPEA